MCVYVCVCELHTLLNHLLPGQRCDMFFKSVLIGFNGFKLLRIMYMRIYFSNKFSCKLFFFPIVSMFRAPLTSCDSPFSLITASSYSFCIYISKQKVTFCEARKICLEMGGDMSAFSDADQFAAFREYLASSGKTHLYDRVNCSQHKELEAISNISPIWHYFKLHQSFF